MYENPKSKPYKRKAAALCLPGDVTSSEWLAIISGVTGSNSFLDIATGLKRVVKMGFPTIIGCNCTWKVAPADGVRCELR